MTRHASQCRTPHFNRHPLVLAIQIALAGAWQPALAELAGNALPSGGQVASGQVKIQQNGARMDVVQGSQKAIINWQSYNIGANAHVDYQQPNAHSIALNRVTSGEASVIAGQLTANGQVFLVNPNGVLFAKGAQVDVGAMAASTMNISDADFRAGNYHFKRDGGDTGVVNQGEIRVKDGGYVALLAPSVSNEGLVQARLGTVALAGGDGVTLELDEGKLVNVQVDPATVNTLIENKQLIRADGGRVIMTASAADQLRGAAINNSGVVEAKSLVNRGGSIELIGDEVSNSGTLDVSAAENTHGGNVVEHGQLVVDTGTVRADGNSGGDIRLTGDRVLQTGTLSAEGTVSHGGRITIAADSRVIQTASAKLSTKGTKNGGDIAVTAGGQGGVFSSATLDASGVSGQGGKITVTGGKDVTLAAATLTANGAKGGGKISIGGGFHGKDAAVRNATLVRINPFTQLQADATAKGDGGDIVVWSDQNTDFYGNISAKGGQNGGDGGTVEVSSHDTLIFGGSVATAAPKGRNGNLLLDPRNITIDNSGKYPQFEFEDPNPTNTLGVTSGFGTGTSVLWSTNVVVTNPYDDFGGQDAGAVYLYNGWSGALLATLTGSHADDRLGSGGITLLVSQNTNTNVNVSFNSQGNFLISSPHWDGGKGAVTWSSGTTGLSGTVTSSNSLVGSSASDAVGSGSIVLIDNYYGTASHAWNNENGYLKYLVLNPQWNANTGAVTMGSALSGISGVISSSNSLVGGAAGDQIGSSGVTQFVTEFHDYNSSGALITATEYYRNFFAIASPHWQNGASADAGAVTWASGSAALTGTVSSSNSLVGGNANDQIGSGDIKVLYYTSSTNYNSQPSDTPPHGHVNTYRTDAAYVVASPHWNGDKGSVTWLDGATGYASGGATAGFAVSSANSLVGATAGDLVGSGGIQVLSHYTSRNQDTGYTSTHPYYLILSPHFNNGGSTADAGAITWGDGRNITYGTITTTNYLGNTLTNIPTETTTNNGGVSGVIGSGNSLVGSHAGDQVGSGGVTDLGQDPGYVVLSPLWNSSAGAVTFWDATATKTGTLGSANSLVGSTANDHVGGGGILLKSGYYLVLSPDWDNGGATDTGAITWGSKSSGVSGAVGAGNSLVGSTANDGVGSDVNNIVDVGVADYVVLTPTWDNGGNADAGAASWGSSGSGVSGAISSSNSLIGSHANDRVGSGGVVATYNGVDTADSWSYTYYYSVISPHWNADRGAVTMGAEASGIQGTVGSGNSLVGDTAGDQVGSGGVKAGQYTTLTYNGSSWSGTRTAYYLIASPNWSDGGTANVGAVTKTAAANGITGSISSANSLIGGTAGDQIGSGGITLLPYDWTTGPANANGQKQYHLDYYAIASPYWDNGATADAGAVTWGSVTTTAGAASPLTGNASAANSLVGTHANDRVGSGGVVALPAEYNNTTRLGYVVISPNWGNGTDSQLGAVTWGSRLTGLLGAVSAGNSLIGATAGDQIGSGGVTVLTNGYDPVNSVYTYNYLVLSPHWHSGANADAGAVTWVAEKTGFAYGESSQGAVVGIGNSLVGSHAGDQVGSDGVIDLGVSYLVGSRHWHNGSAADAGALSWARASIGGAGAVSAGNSLIGSYSNQDVGLNQVRLTVNYNTYYYDYLVIDTDWRNGGLANAGSVTYGDAFYGIFGEVSVANSVVGTTANSGISFDTGGPWVDYYQYAGTNYFSLLPGFAYDHGDTFVVSFANEHTGRVTSGATDPSRITYGMAIGKDMTIAPGVLTNLLGWGTNVTLQASNDITVNSALNVAGLFSSSATLTLEAGRSIYVNADISTDGGNLVLHANDLAANGVIDADRAAGNAVIEVANGVTIDAGAGSVTMELRDGAGNTEDDSGNITLAGQILADTISIVHRGTGGASGSKNIVLNSGASLTASGSGDALVLAAASGGEFLNSVGSNVLSAANGRWLVYMHSPSGSTEGGLTGAAGSALPRLYNRTYDGNAPGTIVAGNHLIYDYQPSLSVDVGNISKTYGDADPSASSAFSGYVNDDGVTDSSTVAGLSGSPSFSIVGGTAGTGRAVGSYTVNGAVGSAAISGGAGYSTTIGTGGASGTLTVNKKTLTVTASNDSRAYNGSGYSGGHGVNITGLVNSETSSVLGGSVSYGGTSQGATNAGSYAITASGYTASNYDFSYVDGTLTITPFVVSLTGSRTYNGSTNVAAGIFSAGSLVGSETLNLSGTGTIASKNVGTGKAVTLGTLALADGTNGGLASNYTLSGGTHTADISAASLTVSTGDVSKAYDGGTTAAGTATITSGSLYGSDSLSGGTFAFSDKNVGAGNKTVTVSGVTVSDGNSGANYSVSYANNTTSTITPFVVSLTGNRTYNGSANVAAGIFSAGSLVGSETLSLSGTGTIASKNVGTGKAVTLGTLALADGTNGGLASNYTLSGGTHTADISAASLTVSTSDVSKAYDGGTTAAGTATIMSGSLYGSDSLSGGTFAFSDKNVGAGNKTVTVSGVTVSDGNSGANYSVSYANNTTGTITPFVVSLTGNRTYNGSANVAAGIFSAGSLVGSETLNLSGTGTIASKNVGTGKAVTLGTLALADGTNGGLASNYTLSGGTHTADISAASLTVSTSDVSKAYDGGTTAAGTATITSGSLYGSDSLSGGTFAFSDKNVGSGNKTVTVSGVTVSDGNSGANYSVSYANNTTSTITPFVVSLTGNRTYNGSANVAAGIFSAGSLVGSETLNLSGTGTIASKNVGTGKAVTLGTLALADGTNGGLASNYTLSGGTHTADISAASLTVSTSDVSKAYDGGTTAAGTATITSGSLYGSDSLGGGTFAFSDKNVGSGNKTVTVSGVTVSDGNSGANYSVSYANNTTSTITPFVVSLTGSRTYNGSTNVAAGVFSAGSLVGSETLNLSGTGTIASKNVGTGKTVTLGTLALADGTNGGLASNYTLSGGTHTADISAASLTVSTSDVSKAYDGGTTAAGTATITSGSLYGSDSLGGGTFAFSDKNVGSGNKTVTVSGVTVSDGNSGANYSVSYANNTTSTITPFVVSLTGSRTYNGSTNVAAGVFSAGSLVGSETLNLSGTGTIASKNVGTGKTVTLGTLALADGTNGGLASNYTLSGGTHTADISAASLTVSTSDVSKAYDGGTTAAGTATITSGSLYGSDSLSGGTFAFSDKNVGAGNKTVTVSGVTVSDGNSGANYSVSYANNTTSTITPFVVSLTGSRTYNGSTNVAAGIFSAGSLVGSETLNLSGTGTIASKNVGTGKAVTLGTLALADGTNGGLASNYTLSGGTHTADIGAYTVDLTGSRTYDGTTVINAASLTTSTLVGGETLTLTGAGSVADQNVGTGKTVALGSLALGDGDNGGLASNYTLVGGTRSADVTAYAVSLTGNRSYDGSTNAAANIFAMSTLVGSETLSLTGTGTVADKNVGVGKSLTLGSLALADGSNGGLASNYTLAGGTHNATISAANLTVGTENVSKTYDGNTSAIGTAIVSSGTLYGSDSLIGGSFAFTDKNVGIGTKTVTVAAVTVNDGNSGDNYSVSYLNNTTSTINPFVVSLSGGRSYDGTTAVAAGDLHTGSLVGGETLILTGAGALGDKNVGTGKTVSLGSLALADGSNGGLASNYTLIGGDLSADISQANLVLTTSDVIKTYDGTTSASGTPIVKAGSGSQLFGSDSLSGGVYTFTDKNANGSSTVTVSGISVSDGNGGNNYSISYSDNTTSTVLPYVIHLTGSRVFDGSNVVNSDVFNLGTLVGNETLLLSGAGLMSDNRAGIDKPVDLGTLALADGGNGGLASNYTLAGGNPMVTILQPPTVNTPAPTETVNAGTVVPDNGGSSNSNNTGSGGGGGRTTGLAMSALRGTDSNRSVQFSIADSGINSGGNAASGMATGGEAPTQLSNTVHLLASQSLVAGSQVQIVAHVEVSDYSSGFSFALPAGALSTTAGEGTVTAKMGNGEPLPAWLNFNSHSLSFSTDNAGAAQLPLQVVITQTSPSGQQKSIVVTIEKQGQAI
ncbi:YDG domain-containing protein [Methylomonas sp. MS20]|uniref:YDG domain-containing protein n=1 Tax=unclassified Methylomonas TaxID=2608980 RepID=UPI0028A4BFE3|nr:YDG domain-containing protein [Methylomonas sp. MV1]MDT4332468.1 YDG domain-containing protein [Methylomonas sp. MV1]